MSESNQSNMAAENRRRLMICCAVCFGCYFGTYMRIPVFPLFATSLGADAVKVGLLNALFLLMAGLLCVPAGVFSDRFGRRLPILGGILILSCSSLMMFFSSSISQLVFICILSGIGTAVLGPPLMSYVADVTPASRLGTAFGWYTTCLYGGMTVGPAIGGLVGRVLGFRPVFLIAGILIFTFFWVVLFYMPVSTPAATAVSRQRFTFKLFYEVLGNNRLLVCLGAMLGSSIGYGLFITFIPLYARQLGLNAAHIGMVFAAQALANALSRIPFGRMGDRLGDRGVLVVIGLCGFSLSLVILGAAGSLGMLLLGAVVFGVTLGLAFTALVALTAEAAPAEQRGLALGLYNSCLYLGMTISSALMGFVISGYGYSAAFYVCGFISLLLAPLFFLLHRNPEVHGSEELSIEISE